MSGPKSARLTVEAFYDQAMAALQWASRRWPSETVIALGPKAFALFYETNKAGAIADFTRAFGHLATQLMEGPETAEKALAEIAAHEAFSATGLLDKLAELKAGVGGGAAGGSSEDAEALGQFWAYVSGLARFSSMYDLYAAVPDKILDSVDSIATKLKQRIDSEGLSNVPLNPFALGQEVMSSFSPDEMQGLMAQLTAKPEALMGMIQKMSTIVGTGGPGGGAAGTAGLPGGLHAGLAETIGQMDLGALFKGPK
jgi:hypothetical protein